MNNSNLSVVKHVFSIDGSSSLNFLFFTLTTALLVIGGFFIANLTLAAAPKTVYVDDNYTTENAGGHTFGTDAFTTIQSAIDAASPYDTINVAAGTYTEQLLITKNGLIIQAADGEHPIIQAPGLSSGIQRLIDIRGNGVTFKGFEVVGNGHSDLGNDNGRYSGIRIDGEGITVENNSIRDLLTGIQTTSTNGATDNIIGNTISNVAVGISLQNDNNVVIGNNITANSVGFGIASFNTTFESNVITITGENGVEAKISGGADGPSYKGSIQDGINAVRSGDTVSAAAGTYSENIYLNKAVNLIGENENNTVITNNGGAVITIDSVTGPMTVSGLTIDANNIPNESGIYIQNASSNITVAQNNIINFTDKGVLISNNNSNTVKNNAITGSSNGSRAGIYIDNESGDNTIGGDNPSDGNTIVLATSGSGDIQLYGVWLAGPNSKDNTVKNNTITGGKRGFQQDSGVSGKTTFSQNTIKDSGSGIVYEGGEAIISDNSLENITGNGITLIHSSTHDCTMSGNTLKNISVGASGKNGEAMAWAIYLDDGTSNNTVSNNTVTDSELGIWISNGASNNSFTNNTLDNNRINVQVDTYNHGTEPTGLTFSKNKFTNATVKEFINNLKDAIDAKNNYWGTAVKKDINISNKIDFEPYYIDAETTTLNTDSMNTIFVDDDYTEKNAGSHTYGYDAFSSIQDAIGGATEGMTIIVAAGTYNERIVINKPLTLRGATYNVNKNGYTVPANYAWDENVESIINNPSPALSESNVVDIISDDVTFEGFVVQSLNALTSSSNDHLLRINASTGTANDGKKTDDTLDNIVIKNNIIGPNTNTASQNGTNGRMGLYFASPNYPNDERGITNTIVTGNKIFDCKGNGNNIFVWGSAKSYNSPSNANYSGTVIKGNEIYGSHRSGIEIAGGVYGLEIKNNKIHDNRGLTTDNPNDLKYGNGIVTIRMSSDKTFLDGMGSDDITIKNNEIYNNEKNGIYMGPMNSNHSIKNNNLYNNGGDSIRVDLEENYHAGNVKVYDKTSNIDISDNDINSVKVIGTPANGFTINAIKNWWGSESGPTTGKVGDNVIFSPYYKNATKTSLSDDTHTDATYSSTTTGQADLPEGITSVELSDSTNLDVSTNMSTASDDGNINIGGSDKSLDNFTNGNLSGEDLTAPKHVGGKDVVVSKAVVLKSGTDEQPFTLTNSNLSNVTVTIPDKTTVLAPSGWDGIITPPKSGGSNSGNAPSGFSVGNTVIEVGSANNVLLFDQPVAIVLAGVTGNVGYRPAGSDSWTQITALCGGNYSMPSAPSFPGECYISNGTDTKIYTYHFTSFASLNTIVYAAGPSSGSTTVATTTTTPTVSVATNKFDTNKDAKVDILDFNALMTNWGKNETGNLADFNGDNKVDILDFNSLMINWTK